MDVVTATEIDRRAWAVEQAVKLFDALGRDGFAARGHGDDVTGMADRLLGYVNQPVQRAEEKLIDAARSYDGTQNAAALIGALADALEAR